jgi:hypothetical protein
MRSATVDGLRPRPSTSSMFGIDVLVCPQCAGPRRVLAAIHDPAAIARALGALGLTAAGADQAGYRAPPAAAGFDDTDEGNAAE